MNYPVVTLCGSKSLANPWVLPCLNSWKNILNADVNSFHIVSDGELTYEDALKFRDMNFTVFEGAHEIIADDFLSRYPTLKAMRKKEIMWRKLLDPLIHLRFHERIIILDTDVLIQDEIILPGGDYDIAYMRDDVPAYVGNWKMIWQQPMVPALNAGFIVINPKAIDFDQLELIVKKYIINNSADTWLSEQTAWACIAGSLKKRLLLKGNKARVLTGMVKRPLKDIVNNKFKYRVGKEMTGDFEVFKQLTQDCSIMHFPNAKRFMMNCLAYLETIGAKKNIEIEGYRENNMTFVDKVAISAKLFLKEHYG